MERDTLAKRRLLLRRTRKPFVLRQRRPFELFWGELLLVLLLVALLVIVVANRLLREPAAGQAAEPEREVVVDIAAEEHEAVPGADAASAAQVLPAEPGSP